MLSCRAHGFWLFLAVIVIAVVVIIIKYDELLVIAKRHESK